MSSKPIQVRVKLKADAQGNIPTDIQLLSVGHWHTLWHGAFIFAATDFSQMVENFVAGVGLVAGDKRAPINYGHDAGGKAAGWIKSLYTSNNATELWAVVDWTPAAEQALSDGEYAYISAEAWTNEMPYIDPEDESHLIPNVIDGAAVTNIPLFKKLKPLMASKLQGSSEVIKGDPSMDLAALRAKAPTELKEDEKQFLADHATELTPEERKTFELQTEDEKQAEKDAADQAEADRKATEQAEAKAAKEKEEAEKLEASRGGMTAAQLDKLKADAKAGRDAMEELTRTKLTASIEKHVARGAIKSAELTSTVDMLMASDEKTREAQLKFMDGLPNNQLLASEAGTGHHDEAPEITDAERKYASDFGNSEEQLIEFKKNHGGTN